MRVSVALAAYNCEQFVGNQINSIMQQTRQVDEVVVCDDGSNDRTGRILREFAENSEFEIRILHNRTNSGVIAAFEKAIARCTGEVVLLSDCDDVWYENKVETLVRVFEECPDVEFAFSDSDLVDRQLKHLNTTYSAAVFGKLTEGLDQADLLQVLASRNVVGGASCAIRSTLIPFLLPFPRNLNVIHDGWIAIAATAVARIQFINESLFMYRQHPGQSVGVRQGTAAGKAILRSEVIESALNETDSSIDLVRFLRHRVEARADAMSQDGRRVRSIIAMVDRLLKDLAKKRSHFMFRLSLPANRLRRIRLILGEFATGTYRKYSNGLRSAVRDSIEE